MIQVDKLKSLIKDNIKDIKFVNGGDNNDSYIALIPRDKFRSSFGIDTIIKEKYEKQE